MSRALEAYELAVTNANRSWPWEFLAVAVFVVYFLARVIPWAAAGFPIVS